MSTREQPQPENEPVTLLLQKMEEGDAVAAEALYDLVYEDLRGRARRILGGAAGQTLAATAVVHEAWLKLAGSRSADWQNRDHFLRVAAKAMRSVVVDHARAKRTDKRGGQAERVRLGEVLQVYEERAIDVLVLNEALERLAAMDGDLARLVELRFFGGLTIAETASVLGVSTPTVERGWRFARSWLRTELSEGEGDASDEDG